MKKVAFPLAVLFMIVLAGCAPKNNYFTSQEKYHLNQSNGDVVMNDFISLIRDYYNPSQTKFIIDAENTKSYFFVAAESRLRELGFGVGNYGDSSATWLAWKIDRLDNGLLIVNYLIGDSKYTRAYSENHGEFTAISQFTVLNQRERVAQAKLTKQVQKNVSKDENKSVQKKDDQSDIFSAFLKSDGFIKRAKVNAGEHDAN